MMSKNCHKINIFINENFSIELKNKNVNDKFYTKKVKISNKNI